MSLMLPTSKLYWAYALLATTLLACSPVPGQEKDTTESTQSENIKRTEDIKEQVTEKATEPSPEKTDEITGDAGTEAPQPDTVPEGPSVDTVNPEELPGEVIIRQQVLTPASFQTISYGTEEWALPTALAKVKTFHMTIHAGATTVLGTENGFYKVFTNANKKNVMTRVDNRPVVGIASWKNTEIVVAHAKQIFLWDGTDFSPTQFYRNLDGSDITALAERDQNSFWIGTKDSLWLYDTDNLQQFKSISDITGLLYMPSKKLLLIRDGSGAYSALQQSGGTWTLRSFKGEGLTLSAMTPSKEAGVDFWGFDDKKTLNLRKENGTNAAWWMFRLKPDTSDKTIETMKITHILFQQKTEETWSITNTQLFTLTEKDAQSLAIPGGITNVMAATSTPDGNMWLSDGTKLVKFGGTAPVYPGYAKDVEPLIKKHCIRCHSTGTPSPNLSKLADIKASIDAMIRAMERTTGWMPKDAGQVPVNEINVFKGWKAGGFKP
ncbi:MAG: hypothetical protein CL920_03985 [Deltaproteobacteria bacterium]|nr:hypothetical protein [Deltaproteobacteria bacterium]MBU47835.1 hypothetical protein [Deltaproteobacteria bacterium]